MPHDVPTDAWPNPSALNFPISSPAGLDTIFTITRTTDTTPAAPATIQAGNGSVTLSANSSTSQAAMMTIASSAMIFAADPESQPLSLLLPDRPAMLTVSVYQL